MAKIICSVASDYKKKQIEAYQNRRKEARKAREGLPKSLLPKIEHGSDQHDSALVVPAAQPNTFPEVVVEVRDQTGRPQSRDRSPAHPLARVLLSAARLYEAMIIFRDRKLVEEFLCKEPPLHPRRTLDQSYYWTLRSTEARDRDQVVYRHTHSNPNSRHKFARGNSGEQSPQAALSLLFHGRREKKGLSENGSGWSPSGYCTCPGKCHCSGKVVQNDHGHEHDCKDCMDKWCWSSHTADEDEYGCDICRSEIRKISRVIMVDQLWMWILDESTILTCYPRRYGVNKPDPSGVHKSIRLRLKAMTRNELRSAYDLALVILDECSNTFFDRTKARDSQPRLTDIFSESIGIIVRIPSIAMITLKKSCRFPFRVH